MAWILLTQHTGTGDYDHPRRVFGLLIVFGEAASLWSNALYLTPPVWLDFQMSLSQGPVEPDIVSYLLFTAAMTGQTLNWLSARC